MKVVTEILQDLEILKRLLKHNANLKIRINYYLTCLFPGRFSVAPSNYIKPFGVVFRQIVYFYSIQFSGTVLPAKSDSEVMLCLQSYHGLIINRSLVY